MNGAVSTVVVDDHPEVRRALQRILGLEGHRCRAAASVVERPTVRTALAAALVLWLDAPPEVLAARMTSSSHRPDYGEPLEVLWALDRRRRPLFTAVTDVVIDATQATETVQRDALAAVDVAPPPYT